MKLVAITTKSGKNYTIGTAPVHLNDEQVVEKIIYHRAANLYNKGFQTGEPGYSIAITGSTIRHLVPEHEVAEIWVDIAQDKKKKQEDDEAPEMENFLADTEEDQDAA